MLTEQEKSELTLLAFLGFDIIRAEKPDTRLPCWLCCSDETKQDAITKALDFLNRHAHPVVPFTEFTAEEYLQKNMAPVLRPNYQRWIDAEQDRKAQREAGNPTAFFT